MFASLKRLRSSALVAAVVGFAAVGAAAPALAMGGGPGGGPNSGSFNLNSYGSSVGFPSGGYGGEGGSYQAEHGDAGLHAGKAHGRRHNGGSVGDN